MSDGLLQKTRSGVRPCGKARIMGPYVAETAEEIEREDLIRQHRSIIFDSSTYLERQRRVEIYRARAERGEPIFQRDMDDIHGCPTPGMAQAN